MNSVPLYTYIHIHTKRFEQGYLRISNNNERKLSKETRTEESEDMSCFSIYCLFIYSLLNGAISDYMYMASNKRMISE
jgi:hypothetical protein